MLSKPAGTREGPRDTFTRDLITAAVGGLVGGLLAGFTAFGVALLTLHKERQRSALERREQYIVEACSDIVDRAWSATNAAEDALEAGKLWDAHHALDELSIQMWGQGPRYRHAGIADFADSVRTAARELIGTAFEVSEENNADRVFRDLISEPEQTPADAASESDEATEARIRATLAELLPQFRRLLREQFEFKISSYSPGQPLDGFDVPDWRPSSAQAPA